MISPSFFVIGHPLGHSMSPFIHNRLFELGGRVQRYAAREIQPDRLEEELGTLLKTAGGLNVTIPYKQAVIPFLDGLEGRAALYRSVNTVRIGEDGCRGYNTDAEGFLCALRGAGIALKGRLALLGSGGVAYTFACEAARAGCAIVNAVRPSGLHSAEALGEFVCGLVPGTDYAITTLDKLEGDFDLLINATPVGMYPHGGELPVSEGVLKHTAAAFDAVYNPRETALLACVRANGARVADGLPMLVWQAAAAHTIWFGTKWEPDVIAGLIDETEQDMLRRFCK